MDAALNDRPVAVLFDIDEALITSGGAGAVCRRRAFEDLYGIPADIGKFYAGTLEKRLRHSKRPAAGPACATRRVEGRASAQTACHRPTKGA